MDFSLLKSDQGVTIPWKRVAYSVNGGKWISWGKYAKSTQYIKGLKLGRTYSIRIRGYSSSGGKGGWSPPSDAVDIKM